MGKKDTVELDKKIGRRVKELRLTKGISQQELGDELNVSFQQIQKYEKGADRISSSTLFRTSQILGVPVESFFQGFDNEESSGEKLKLTPQIVRLIKDFEALPKEKRKGLMSLLQILKKT
jgi:transcriptional regulator with XRE-family HTH domain